MKRQSGEQGFTLFELVMVFVMIGLIAASVAPGMPNLANIRAKFAAYKIRSDLRYAQTLALGLQLRTRVVFNATADTYALEQEASPGTWSSAAHPGTRQAYTVAMNSGDYEGVDINSVSFNGASTLIFDPALFGAPLDASAAALTDPGQIQLNATFQLRVRAQTGKVEIVQL